MDTKQLRLNITFELLEILQNDNNGKKHLL